MGSLYGIRTVYFLFLYITAILFIHQYIKFQIFKICDKPILYTCTALN